MMINHVEAEDAYGMSLAILTAERHIVERSR